MVAGPAGQQVGASLMMFPATGDMRAHFHGCRTWSLCLNEYQLHIGEAMWEKTKGKMLQDEARV